MKNSASASCFIFVSCIFGIAWSQVSKNCAEFANVYGKVPADIQGNRRSISLTTARQLVTPAQNSPYQKYSNIGFLTSGKHVDDCYTAIGFRFSDGDRCTVNHIKGLLNYFDKNTAVFLDSGGPHSIAMATVLVSSLHYQPIWKFGSELHPNASISVQQHIGSFKYHASAFANRKYLGNEPPVFITDTHRDSMKIGNSFDNSHILKLNEYPMSEELKKQGIKRIIWITEGETDSEPKKMDKERFEVLTDDPLSNKKQYADPATVLENYSKSGISPYQLRIDPYDCPFSRGYEPSKLRLMN